MLPSKLCDSDPISKSDNFEITSGPVENLRSVLQGGILKTEKAPSP
jgi:hypothetical protein